MMRTNKAHFVARYCLFLALLLLLPLPLFADSVAVGRVTVAGTEPVQGMAGVMVSDGLTIVRTDAGGNYTLPLAADARFVMIINPPGCAPRMNFHQRLPEDRPAQVTADFAVEQSGQPIDAPFTFVQITDSHMASSMPWAQDIITPLNALTPRPAFVMETGDISCHTGDISFPMETYGQLLEMPYFPVTGNHDEARSRGDWSFAGAEFESVFGPWYYAWYKGRYLFVGLPWSRQDGSLDGAAQWLEQLLAMNAATEQAHVIVGFHYWDGFGPWGSRQLERFLGIFRNFSIRAVFMGHWHMSRVHEAFGIPVYMTRTTRLSNRDLADGGFLLVTAEPDGTLRPEFRTVGYDKNVQIVSPADGIAVPKSPQPLVVNAYDTVVRVESVAAALHDPDTQELLQQVALHPAGGGAWTGEIIPADTWPGQVHLAVAVADEHDETWPVAEANITFAATPMPQRRPAADWTMLQRDAHRSGMADGALAPPLTLAWAHATSASFGLNSPIIVDGTLYVSLENNYEPSAPVPAVLALDAATGELRWTYSLGGRSVRGTLAGNSQALCALADDGTVFALDPHSGRVLWEQTNLVPEPAWQELFNGSPMLHGTVAVAGAGPGLSAYDLLSGNILWEKQLVTEGGRRWTPDPSPAVVGEDLVLAWNSVHAFALDSGEESWEFAHPTMITFSPTITGEKIITILADPDERRTRYLVALDKDSGEQLWAVPMSTRQYGIYSSPVVTEDRVYALDDRHLYAVDCTTGELLWKLEVLDSDDRSLLVTGSAALSGDHLYFIHSNGILKAVNTATRQVEWSYDLGTRVDSSPAISGNMLYITGRDGIVYAFVAASE